ncbi:MAG: hypothetical protein ACRDNH_01790 [Gaiellaceae bacterium]
MVRVGFFVVGTGSGRKGGFMSCRAVGRRALVALAAVVAAWLVVGAGGASAGRVDPPGHQDANHCIIPSGVDLNALFGVPEQFRTRICTVISAGEHWRIFGFWYTDDGVDSVYPEGYVPLRPLPIEDFVAKFSVKVVIDGGTSQQKTYLFSSAEALRTDITLDQLMPGNPPFPMAAIMPRLQPLSVGDHTLQVIWVLSAQHCDGLGTVIGKNCLPAGELDTGVRPITVTTPAP